MVLYCADSVKCTYLLFLTQQAIYVLPRAGGCISSRTYKRSAHMYTRPTELRQHLASSVSCSTGPTPLHPFFHRWPVCHCTRFVLRAWVRRPWYSATLIWAIEMSCRFSRTRSSHVVSHFRARLAGTYQKRKVLTQFFFERRAHVLMRALSSGYFPLNLSV